MRDRMMGSAWRSARREAVLARLREENAELRRALALEARVAFLEAENAQLRRELREAHTWAQQVERELAETLAGKLANEAIG